MPRCGTPLDSLAAYLSKTLAYGPNERDLVHSVLLRKLLNLNRRMQVVLHHNVHIRQPSGKVFSHDIDLVAYGDISRKSPDCNIRPHSAMARTVGYTAAIAANMVLTGEVQVR